MILKPKPLAQQSDEELDKSLEATALKQQRLDRIVSQRRHNIPAGVAACGIILGFYGIVKLAFMTGSVVLAPLGVMAASAAAFAGVIGYSVGWAKICDGLFGRWQSHAENIQLEKKKRALERTPSFREAMRQAAEATAKKIKDIFNTAVDRTFHGGTEKPVAVKGPLKLKKTSERKKRKLPFGL
jgi:hypothetical protein